VQSRISQLGVTLVLAGSLSCDSAADLPGEAGGASIVDAAASGGSSWTDAADRGVEDVGASSDTAPERAPSGGDAAGVGLAAKYPGDLGIGNDPAVLFASDFENDLAGWTSFTRDPTQMAVLTDAAVANGGSKYLRAQVTRTQLAADQYISANAQIELSRRVPEVFWRFYARFVGQTATPHHWVRVAAGTTAFQSDGLANTVPPGDQGFWFDLDAHADQLLSFYVYWYKMRSGRCNDGTAVPGCAGDQGTTYYYGNNFSPAGQTPFARDTWLCIEIRAKANTVGTSDGELSLFMDDQLVGEYGPGSPRGRWLRDNFYTWGQYYQDVQAFEGFDFRSSDDVIFKRLTLDAYYERGTLPAAAPEEQIILYDDVVVATSRIGCKSP
jgi:hypothetical protein